MKHRIMENFKEGYDIIDIKMMLLKRVYECKNRGQLKDIRTVCLFCRKY